MYELLELARFFARGFEFNKKDPPAWEEKDPIRESCEEVPGIF